MHVNSGDTAWVLASAALVMFMTPGLLKLTDITVGLRVTPDDEDAGLDQSQHGEAAYTDFFGAA